MAAQSTGQFLIRSISKRRLLPQWEAGAWRPLPWWRRRSLQRPGAAVQSRHAFWVHSGPAHTQPYCGAGCSAHGPILELPAAVQNADAILNREQTLRGTCHSGRAGLLKRLVQLQRRGMIDVSTAALHTQNHDCGARRSAHGPDPRSQAAVHTAHWFPNDEPGLRGACHGKKVGPPARQPMGLDIDAGRCHG